MTKGQFRLFLLTKLPLAYIAGVKQIKLSSLKAVIGISHSWLNQNPFRSIYFGALAMAAEISTGILVMNKIQSSGSSISMLVGEMEASFTKKATGHIEFVCDQGDTIDEVISTAIADGNGHQIKLTSVGRDDNGDEVATFSFFWSIKLRKA